MQAKPIAKSVLLVVVVFVVLGLVLGLVALLQGPPTPAPTERSLEQALGAGAVQGDPFGDAGAPPLDVVIELEAGEFTVQSTRLGRAIQVHAEYDESLYRLEQEFSPAPGRGDRFWLRYGSRGNWRHLRRGLHALRQELGSGDGSRQRHEEIPSRVRVELPVNVPMRLELHVEKGTADIDLSGLSLHGLVVHHGMGELELRLDEPNPVSMDELVLHSKMGEARLSGLGNAQASILEFRGRMGSFELDFDGVWPVDLEASVQITMGDVLLRVPREVRLDTTNRHVFLGGLESSHRGPVPRAEAPESQRTLTLETAVRLGSLTIR